LCVGEYDFLHFPAAAVVVEPMLFAALPVSAQKVFEAVRDFGPLTHAQLREMTEIPPRTIRFAVARLKKEGLLDTRCSLQDCRTCYFFVDKRCIGLEALQAAQEQATHLALAP